MFEGNLDDNTVVTNELPYPIVARYIRVNPQRWARFISMRVEFYGCRFGKLLSKVVIAHHFTRLLNLHPRLKHSAPAVAGKPEGAL